MSRKDYRSEGINVTFNAARCRCSESSNKPFCGNSHRNSGFRDNGTLDKASPGEESGTSRLTITATVNGPLCAVAGIPVTSLSATAAMEASDGETNRRRWYNRM